MFPHGRGFVWYGLIECEVHVHRQVVTSRQLAPPAERAAALLQCGAGKRELPLPQSTNPCSCGRTNYSCLRCKHATCELRSCSKCTSHNVKYSSVDDRATGFTKSAKWHDYDRATLLLWHMLIAKNAPMLWRYAAPRAGTTCWTALATPRPKRKHRWRKTPPRTQLVATGFSA